MKFLDYIDESVSDIVTSSDIISMLKRDCMPFIKEIQSCVRLLYRGSLREYEGIVKITARSNRIPKDSPLKMHNYFDKLFEQKFGWKARSEGVFATSDSNEAGNYAITTAGIQTGNVYLFFPIGQFEYVFSHRIHDFFNFSRFLFPTWKTGPENIENFKLNKFKESVYSLLSILRVTRVYDKEIEGNTDPESISKIVSREMIDTYTDRGLSRAIASNSEISFKCKEYYLVNYEYESKILQEFNI